MVLIPCEEMSRVSLGSALGRLRPKSCDGLAGAETPVKGNRLHCARPGGGTAVALLVQGAFLPVLACEESKVIERKDLKSLPINMI